MALGFEVPLDFIALGNTLKMICMGVLIKPKMWIHFFNFDNFVGNVLGFLRAELQYLLWLVIGFLHFLIFWISHFQVRLFILFKRIKLQWRGLLVHFLDFITWTTISWQLITRNIRHFYFWCGLQFYFSIFI